MIFPLPRSQIYFKSLRLTSFTGIFLLPDRLKRKSTNHQLIHIVC
uniref:Uncharacterized protein n=1 Tax=Arundo donax TaxID=35708 RepID=A0A0A8Y7H3_ARUDO